tara:strand:+ start:2041 stop:2304 length:264 start_codon:yes stop_codon:yes gene_type:complete
MIQAFLFNDLMSLSVTTAILEASDWDESIASRISLIINSIENTKDIDSAKKELKNKLIEEKIHKRIIDKIFILIDIEEANLKGKKLI